MSMQRTHFGSIEKSSNIQINFSGLKKCVQNFPAVTPSASLWRPMGESPLYARVTPGSISKSQSLCRSAVVVWGDPYTEGSETTKVGADVQKPDMRHDKPDKISHHINVLTQKA